MLKESPKENWSQVKVRQTAIYTEPHDSSVHSFTGRESLILGKRTLKDTFGASYRNKRRLVFAVCQLFKLEQPKKKHAELIQEKRGN